MGKKKEEVKVELPEVTEVTEHLDVDLNDPRVRRARLAAEREVVEVASEEESEE